MNLPEDQLPVFDENDLDQIQNFMMNEGFTFNELSDSQDQGFTEPSSKHRCNDRHARQDVDSENLFESTSNPFGTLPDPQPSPFQMQTGLFMASSSTGNSDTASSTHLTPLHHANPPQYPPTSHQNPFFKPELGSSPPSYDQMRTPSGFPHQNPQDTLTPPVSSTSSSPYPFSSDSRLPSSLTPMSISMSGNNSTINTFPSTLSHQQNNQQSQGHSKNNGGAALPPQMISPPDSTLFNSKSTGFQNDENNDLFNKYFEYCNQARQGIHDIREQQSHLLVKNDQSAYSPLATMEENLKRTIDGHLRELDKMLRSQILAPPDLFKIWNLRQQFHNFNTHLELLYQELSAFANNQNQQQCFVILSIVDQDNLPLTLQKGKASDEGITVELLSGTQARITNIREVHATVVLDPLVAKQISGGTSTKNLENDTEMFDQQNQAVFHPKFMNGSRKTLATLKFKAQLSYNNIPIEVVSLNSSPFVITTNDIQYEEAEGILIRQFAFGSTRKDVEVPWPYLANILHAFFLRGTRQDAMRPIRSFSRGELDYLHQKFFGARPMVSCKQFDNFYDWFGKNLQKIRYQRHLCSMFQSGLIYGFVNREFVQDLLQDQPRGTFVIRFSERHPGTIAICYVIDDPDPNNRVRHYLITSEDVYGAKKTLPDFLIEWNIFTSVIQITREPNGSITHTLVDKTEALDVYRTKKTSSSSDKKSGGYDNELIGGKG